MFNQILDLVGQPPGSLVYHFIILFAVEAAFAISIGQWMRERDSSTFRLSLAIFTIFCGRIIVLLASLAAWQGYLPRNVLLPPIERAIDTLTITSLAWAFITMGTPDIQRRNFGLDVIGAAIMGLTLIGFGGTYYFWTFGTASEQLFNGLWIDQVWALSQIALTVIGLIWMATRARSVYDLFLKGILLIVLGAGAVIHLVSPGLGDVAAAVRVSQIIAMPMLAAVTYRHVVEQLLHWDEFEPSWPATVQPAIPVSVPLPEEDVGTGPVPAEPAPGMADDTIKTEPVPTPEPRSLALPQTLEVIDAISGLLGTLEPSELVREAPRVVATALKADICVMAIVDEAVQQAAILGGYDNITQAPLPQDMLDLAEHPTVVNALGRLRQMRLTTQRNSRELKDLYRRLLISHEGPAYIQPLVNGEERIGVLIVASPYSTRLFSNEERNLLDRLGPLVTAALLNAEAYKDVESQVDAAQTREATLSANLSDELTAKVAELNTANRQIEEMKSYIRDMHRQLEEVPQQQEAARTEISRLAEEADRLREAAEQAEALEEEIKVLREKSAEQTASERIRKRYEEQLEESRMTAQAEIAAMRVRLTQASISQQEVTFLQENLAAKAREVVNLQTRLTEAQAVADALRAQVSESLTSTTELEALQTRIAAQAKEISVLNTALSEAKNAALDESAFRAQEEMDQIDREAMAQLEAQLADRTVSIEALEHQLSEKAEAVAMLKSHMADVNASLQQLEGQLTHKTEEVTNLQRSLAKTRAQARDRIAALQAELEAGTGDSAAIDRAQSEALEAELAEKAAAIETLEAQLENAQFTMSNLEQQLNATHQAVDEAISDAQQVSNHDEVIASIAQELRTPMSSIMGYTELLLRESVGILGPLQRKFLQRVKANTERMGTLLDNLIRISTMDTGQMRLEPERVDVHYAVEEVLMNITNQFSEKGVVLRLVSPPELPPITTDREALLEIIQHLLINAALASPIEGSVELQMMATRGTVPLFGGGEINVPCLKLAVEDSGGGVAPEDFERVFMRKYRAENPLIEGLGDTGVGLSLAKALVEAQGGQIWLESDHGVGTVFHVLLPLEPPGQGDGS